MNHTYRWREILFVIFLTCVSHKRRSRVYCCITTSAITYLTMSSGAFGPTSPPPPPQQQQGQRPYETTLWRTFQNGTTTNANNSSDILAKLRGRQCASTATRSGGGVCKSRTHFGARCKAHLRQEAKLSLRKSSSNQVGCLRLFADFPMKEANSKLSGVVFKAGDVILIEDIQLVYPISLYKEQSTHSLYLTAKVPVYTGADKLFAEAASRNSEATVYIGIALRRHKTRSDIPQLDSLPFIFTCKQSGSYANAIVIGTGTMAPDRPCQVQVVALENILYGSEIVLHQYYPDERVRNSLHTQVPWTTFPQHVVPPAEDDVGSAGGYGETPAPSPSPPTPSAPAAGKKSAVKRSRARSVSSERQEQAPMKQPTKFPTSVTTSAKKGAGAFSSTPFPSLSTSYPPQPANTTPVINISGAAQLMQQMFVSSPSYNTRSRSKASLPTAPK